MDPDSPPPPSKEVRGFTINENGSRVPYVYQSDQERAWYESQELLDAKLYEEAQEKLDEYHEYVTKFDWESILRIEVGLLEVKPTKIKFENAKHAWRQALWYDGGSGHDQLVKIANEMIYVFAKKHKIPLIEDDFSKADVEGTAKILEFMLSLMDIGNDQECYDLRNSEFLHIFTMGIRNLREKGDSKKAHKFFKSFEKFSCYKDSFVECENPFEDD